MDKELADGRCEVCGEWLDDRGDCLLEVHHEALPTCAQCGGKVGLCPHLPPSEEEGG